MPPGISWYAHVLTCLPVLAQPFCRASIAITDHTNFSADTSATNIQSWEVG